jgi:hypothetical protein
MNMFALRDVMAYIPEHGGRSVGDSGKLPNFTSLNSTWNCVAEFECAWSCVSFLRQVAQFSEQVSYL